jgi:hypothetical protein
MTGGELGTLLYGTAGFGSLCLQIYNAFKSNKRDEKVEQIHLATNSLKDELVATTHKEAYTAGVKKGREANHSG